ncbi:Major Facilitator Superfamily protein [Ceratocystis platani]|uniref:Major Facilitator Superfamily protein n=1 Tax=Ceratocystis fimbriata f. sp. platani TaxID=88771 RepID=A0A0F8AZX3_CERFI|nr:Major Facilitator Superfamily protein [Ceratocystis platani]
MASLRRYMRALLPFSPTTTGLQAATYLLGISLFSISFLVFLNSSVSFVITDLIGRKKGVGDVVGTLGFADEAVALVMCPVWGLVSDRLGVRWVAVLGYVIVGIALVVFVQARNVYPQLLLARVFFALGATACATMVTAILPSLADDSPPPSGSPFGSGGHEEPEEETSPFSAPTAREKPPVLAGFVGLFTGCGALVALLVFLPLPARFSEQDGVSQSEAVTRSFYVVAAVALCVAGFVAVGLRGLKGEEDKGWRTLFGLESKIAEDDGDGCADGSLTYIPGRRPLPYLHLMRAAVRLGFVDADIGLGYLGGFVARASTVAISLFVPLFINTFFISNGFCHGSPHDPSPELKKECRTAYILASVLTGVAQLMGFVCAPLFGYLARRPGKWNIPLIISTLSGVAGYTAFPLLRSPELRDVDGRGGSRWVLVPVALMGISQIGAIVCSLGLLGRGVIDSSPSAAPFGAATIVAQTDSVPSHHDDASDAEYCEECVAEEGDCLLPGGSHAVAAASRIQLKGSIAGLYSWCGGAAILLLTKAGGHLFDVLSTGAPFYMMAGFNAMLLAAVVAVDIARLGKC